LQGFDDTLRSGATRGNIDRGIRIKKCMEEFVEAQQTTQSFRRDKGEDAVPNLRWELFGLVQYHYKA
jgi:hypothetical protein